MKERALDSMKSVYGKIDPSRNFYSFELFGMDFMIDSDFKVMFLTYYFIN